MNPEIWGPHAWFFLHTITFNYPDKPNEEDKNNIKNYIHSFSKVIPCYTCQKHFIEQLKKTPITDEILQSREKLIDWMINVHNVVNKRNGKKVWTTEEVMEHYKQIFSNKDENNNNINNHKCNKCKNNKNNKTNNFFYIIFCIIIIIIVLYINRKKFI
tara:strand:+ start:628 stop:1101 length:474 start_codon:yes stop_codon:yes gene_type:complete